MPRDLGFPSESASDERPSTLKLSDALYLLKRSDTIDHTTDNDGADAPEAVSTSGYSRRNLDTKSLHTYSAVLTPSNLEACLALEEAIFPPAERCSREKLRYRLQSCNELCLGIFTILSQLPPAEDKILTYAHGRPIDERNFPGQKQVLIGMVVATKTANPFVTDESMEMPDLASPLPSILPPPPQMQSSTSPPLFAQGRQATPGDDAHSSLTRIKGHDSKGKTIAIHTLGILPAYQGKGLGKMLLKGYVQRMDGQHVGRRIALIAHEDLVPLYEGLGFSNKGASDVKLGGGGWLNLVYDIKKPEKASYGRPGMF